MKAHISTKVLHYRGKEQNKEKERNREKMVLSKSNSCIVRNQLINYYLFYFDPYTGIQSPSDNHHQSTLPVPASIYSIAQND